MAINLQLNNRIRKTIKFQRNYLRNLKKSRFLAKTIQHLRYPKYPTSSLKQQINNKFRQTFDNKNFQRRQSYIRNLIIYRK